MTKHRVHNVWFVGPNELTVINDWVMTDDAIDGVSQQYEYKGSEIAEATKLIISGSVNLDLLFIHRLLI